MLFVIISLNCVDLCECVIYYYYSKHISRTTNSSWYVYNKQSSHVIIIINSYNINVLLFFTFNNSITINKILMKLQLVNISWCLITTEIYFTYVINIFSDHSDILKINFHLFIRLVLSFFSAVKCMITLNYCIQCCQMYDST